MLLTTRGRRTGRWRTTAVSFMPIEDGHLVVFSGWGVSSGWYHNLLAEPRVRLKVGLRVYGQTQPVAATTQHALVQIAREALFNVVRHAEAHHAWVTLRWRPQVVSLAIADDGSGNHRKLQHQLFISRPDGGHLGLTGIAERVRSVGGATWFERRRGGGVRLRVEVPLGGAVGVA